MRFRYKYAKNNCSKMKFRLKYTGCVKGFENRNEAIKICLEFHYGIGILVIENSGF